MHVLHLPDVLLVMAAAPDISADVDGLAEKETSGFLNVTRSVQSLQCDVVLSAVSKQTSYLQSVNDGHAFIRKNKLLYLTEHSENCSCMTLC